MSRFAVSFHLMRVDGATHAYTITQHLRDADSHHVAIVDALENALQAKPGFSPVTTLWMHVDGPNAGQGGCIPANSN
jgi:hypothetical protein